MKKMWVGGIWLAVIVIGSFVFDAYPSITGMILAALLMLWGYKTHQRRKGGRTK